jgi:16S rRNA (guanine966-N2)-methyltransferase
VRIVGGTLSGRRLTGAVGEGTRPTSERVREAIASMIDARRGFAGARVLDLYAGTGAMAFEALSRGADSAVLVERDRRAAQTITKAADQLGLSSRARVLTRDAEHADLAAQLSGAFDLVFIDPPYARIAEVQAVVRRLLAANRIAGEALVIIEHGSKTEVTLPPELSVVLARTYGDTAVVLAELPQGRE